MRKNLLNKTVVYISILGIILSAFAFPVFADEVSDPVNATALDILTAPSYSYSINGGDRVDFILPSQYFSNVNSVGWRWNSRYNNIGFQGFVFSIKVYNAQIPDKVQFSPYPGTYVNALKCSSSGDILQYKVAYPINISYVEIRAIWDDGYTGQFSIVDCIGILQDVHLVSNFAFRQVLHMDSQGIDLYSTKTQNNTEVTPFTKQYDDDGYSGQKFYYTVDVGLSYERLNYDRAESATILIGIPSDSASISAYISDNKPVAEWGAMAVAQTLPVEFSLSHTARLDSGSGRYHTMYYYTATVDLEGISLEGKMLHFTFNVEPVDDSYTRWTLYFAAVKERITTPPWYQVFYNWIADFFTRNTTDLKNFLSDILDDSFDSLVEGSSSQNQQVSNSVGGMENSADQMGQLTQDMQVDRPEVSGGSVAADQVIPMSGVNLIKAPILALWTSPTITAAATLTVTVALISFVFFGKKR